MDELFTIENLMMLFFILLLVLSIWKIYVFLPTKPLADDDTTKEATDTLISLMYSNLALLVEEGKEVDNKLLFMAIQNDVNFDTKQFWRFNLNRLNQLINIELLHHNKKNLRELAQ